MINGPSNKRPEVSIIIPTRNEARHIDRCLQSVFAMAAVDGGMEVLIVDGGSEDGTRQILTRWSRENHNMTVLDNPRRIVPVAMNIGIRAARGNWIVRLDGHSVYPVDYLRLCLEASKRTDADNVGGALITLSKNQGFQGKLVQALTTHWFGVGNSGFRVGTKANWVDTVPFGCYRREVFDKIGLFDERLERNQDYELNRRLSRAGGRIWLEPRINVHYFNQASLRGLLKQAFVTGKWNPLMWHLAPYTFRMRHAVPLAFVSALLLAAISTLAWTKIGVFGLGVILLPYLIIALTVSLLQSRRYGRLLFLCLPFSYLVYHLAYGLGGLYSVFLLLTDKTARQRDLKTQNPITAAPSF